MILTSLASVAVLGAAFVASQPSVVKADDHNTATTPAQPAGETGATATPKSEVTSPEIKRAEADAKTAEAKVTEAQAKVDDKTTEATTAATNLEKEKKEAADAEAAKTEAEKAKTVADEELAKAKEEATKADAKAKEEAKKEADEAKKQADTKAELTAALEKLEKDAVEKVNNNSQISDKAKAIEEIKATIGKEDLLKVIESGDIKATDVADALPSENDVNGVEGTTTPATSGDKNALPADLKAKIDEAEKADAARPASEKAQDKADDLGEEIDALKKDTDALKAEADKKSEKLDKTNKTLKETKEAFDSAKENKVEPSIIDGLEKAKTALEEQAKKEEEELAKANADAQAYADELNKLTDEYNKALDEVKAAKEKEAAEPAKPAVETPAKPVEKTEAEKAAEAKKEADAKVAELEKKAAEEATKLAEATTKAEKEAADVTAAQTKKEEAEKAKTDAEAELVKAKEEADKAKAKVEELKKEEKDNLEALKGALEKLEKEAEDTINAKNEIADKAKAIEEAKDVIGKADLLKAIEDGVVTATQAAKELENTNTTLNKDPEVVTETKKLDAEDQKKIDEATKKEASKSDLEKLQDKADDLAEKIEKLAKAAEKDRADAVKKAETLEKQNETLEKAKTALETAKKNKADQAIVAGLQDAVTKLQAAADEAQAKFDEVNESLQAYTSVINDLTDDYNAYLEEIKVLKENDSTVTKTSDFNGGVNDDNAPTQPAKPEGEAPAAKPAASNGDALVQPALPEFGANNPEIKKISDEIAKVKEQLKDAEENEGVEDYYKDGLKDRLADLEDALNTLINNKAASVEKDQLVVTRYIDINTNADILDAEEGDFKGKPIAGYTFVKFIDEDGIITNYYKKVGEGNTLPKKSEYRSTPTGNSNPGHQGDTTAVNEPALVPTTPATPGTAAPATPTAETPATPAVAPTVAGTSQDNTYQAPAAKAEDKQELPNTGGKDNVAVASLGFLGLLLGALPFVKRKN